MWPITYPSPEVKRLVSRFFTLADNNSDDVGEILADEIFAHDGVFITANGIFQGAAEISQSRKGAWATVKSRQHTVLKAYVNEAHGTDIFVVGNLKMEALTGKSELEFVARIEIVEGESGPRISKYQVVSPTPQVSRPIIESE